MRPLEPVHIPLVQARARVLRESIKAPADLPAFDRAAMDGYALGKADGTGHWRLMGEIQPGEPPPYELARGEAVRVFTGSAVPMGAERVVMQEISDVDDSRYVSIADTGSGESYIRRKGEDAKAGQVLMKDGTRIGAGEISLLAQLGRQRARVSPLPRIVHVATGNELVDPSEEPGMGQIRDSNSSLISALARQTGALVMYQERLGDHLEALLYEVGVIPGNRWDLLIISGGASAGSYDFGREALENLGFDIHFHGLNIRPGKPLIFATRKRHAAFVLPGNPVSHFVTYHLAVRVALERLAGQEPQWACIAAATATDLPPNKDARETFAPAHLMLREGLFHVKPLKWQSSGDQTGLVHANALIQMEPGFPGCAAGKMVQCIMVDQLDCG